MAKRFQRRRWRRPQRLTLEGPPPARRKDITMPELLTLEPQIVWQDNRARMAALLVLFMALGGMEGVVLGMVTGILWFVFPGAVLAGLYVIVGARYGDRWMRYVLRCEPASSPTTVNLLQGLASEAGVPVPELVVCPGEAPNAISLGLRRRWVCLTQSALALPRLEQEALLAHELIHLARGDAALASAIVLIGGAPEFGSKALRAPGGPLALLSWPLWPASLVVRAVARLLVPPVREHRADVCGAMLTRYPPGMRALLEAAAVEHEDSRLRATDPFWTAPRVASGTADVTRRAALVAEM